MTLCESIWLITMALQSLQMKIFVQEDHHDFSEVGHGGPVNGVCIVPESVPHSGKRVGDQVHYWDSCEREKNNDRTMIYLSKMGG